MRTSLSWWNSLFLAAAVVGATACGTTATDAPSYSAYVDPFIGTGGHGHTHPAATVPWGFVQAGPQTGTEGWDRASGYHYDDKSLMGFSHFHLSGTGIGDLGDVLLMPMTGSQREPYVPGSHENPDEGYRSRFSHQREVATPGYYSVYLEDYGIHAEMTTSVRGVIHRWVYERSDSAGFLLDLGRAIGWDMPTDGGLRVVNDTIITGTRYSTGWARKQRVFFLAVLSKPIEKYRVLLDTVGWSGSRFRHPKIRARFLLDVQPGDTVELRMGLSAVAPEKAKQNYNEEVRFISFDSLRRQAAHSWEQQLGRVRIEAPDSIKRTFYTALYHTLLAPTIFEDVDDEYSNSRMTSSIAKDYTHHSIFSLWDTFRALHPWYTLAYPDKVDDFTQSMMSHYRQASYKLLPKWELWGNETYTMIGYHSVPVLVDALFKGLSDLDATETLEAMVTTAMDTVADQRTYRQYGYVPYDLAGESVSKTLEFAFDDWVIAQLAQRLRRDSLAEVFSQRALSHRNLLDPTTGLFRPKDSQGEWLEDFDPLEIVAHGHAGGYTEANAWQYSWFVPHDLDWHIEQLGGQEAYVAKLDSLFVLPMPENEKLADVTGLIGLYAHGNEPSHHIPYLYALAGRPDKTQEWVRHIMTDLYSDQPDGLAGNEDCGQLSAWYLFSALGMYPVNPASGDYVLGAPLVDEAEIDLANGKVLRIVAHDQGPDALYVDKVVWNGREVQGTTVSHLRLVKGGTLEFFMSTVPKP